MSQKFFLPMPSGLEYLGRVVYITTDFFKVYRFEDNNALCPIQKRDTPRKWELFLRPTGRAGQWKVEQATCDFQQQEFLIVGSGRKPSVESAKSSAKKLVMKEKPMSANERSDRKFDTGTTVSHKGEKRYITAHSWDTAAEGWLYWFKDGIQWVPEEEITSLKEVEAVQLPLIKEAGQSIETDGGTVHFPDIGHRAVGRRDRAKREYPHEGETETDN